MTAGPEATPPAPAPAPTPTPVAVTGLADLMSVWEFLSQIAMPDDAGVIISNWGTSCQVRHERSIGLLLSRAAN